MKDIHPAATHHFPGFITAPGQTDTLLWVAAIILLLSTLLLGVLFFWLHSLPEREAHKQHKYQMELIAVLCLLSLFTHVHAFWVVALVLAFVKVPDRLIPDIESPLGRIAGAIEASAARRPAEPVETKAQTAGMAPAAETDPGQSGKTKKSKS